MASIFLWKFELKSNSVRSWLSLFVVIKIK